MRRRGGDSGTRLANSVLVTAILRKSSAVETGSHPTTPSTRQARGRATSPRWRDETDSRGGGLGRARPVLSGARPLPDPRRRRHRRATRDRGLGGRADNRGVCRRAPAGSGRARGPDLVRDSAAVRARRGGTRRTRHPAGGFVHHASDGVDNTARIVGGRLTTDRQTAEATPEAYVCQWGSRCRDRRHSSSDRPVITAGFSMPTSSSSVGATSSSAPPARTEQSPSVPSTVR